jgi:uncharacterized cupin superfamily protein
MQKKKMSFKEGFRVAFGNKRAQVAEMVLAPGDSEGDPKNKHKGSDQWLYIVEGRGVAIVNGRKYQLREGVIMQIEKGDLHEIKNTSRALLRTLNLYVPPAYTKSGNPLPAGKRK